MDRGGPYEMAFIHIGGGLDTFARGGRLEVDFDSDRLSPRALCVVLKQRRFEADVGPGRPRTYYVRALRNLDLQKKQDLPRKRQSTNCAVLPTSRTPHARRRSPFLSPGTGAEGQAGP